MYALGLYDTVDRTLLLARDPLGIKPLYYAVVSAAGGEELVFASEPRAVLSHPCLRAKPDLIALSAYLTTIRTVMGTRTLFEGVRTLRPGQAVTFALGGERIETRPLPARGVGEGVAWRGDAAAGVRAAIEDSVRRHLRSDVPICCLLSGGPRQFDRGGDGQAGVGGSAHLLLGREGCDSPIPPTPLLQRRRFLARGGGGAAHRNAARGGAGQPRHIRGAVA
jgi:hypothetical protein